MRKLFKNYKPLTIWIFPGKHKKVFNKQITVDNINSGSTTYSNVNNGVICLWRKEELLKVLLHEIIHSFKIDKNDPIPEAYVELRALIANIYLELLERELPLNHFNELYDIEKKFAVEQSKKIKNIKSDTNIHYYISEKGRLMHCMNKKEWENYLENYESEPFVNKNCLRFTITDKILKNYSRKDNFFVKL